MWGPFKASRSEFGRWLDEHSVSHTELSDVSGVPRTTISSLARGVANKPSRLTARKLIRAMREWDSDVEIADLWDI